jgi:hypothetical protein
MMTFLNVNDCLGWRKLPMLSFGDSISCTSCTLVEKLILDMIASTKLLVILCTYLW